MELPKCPKCSKGLLLPLSDYGDVAPVKFKVWACSDVKCGYGVRIDQGRVSYITSPPNIK